MANAAEFNRTLFISDNLPILRGIDSESIDLIATDPPFNKGVKAFEGIVAAGQDKQGVKVSYKDTWTWGDVQAEWAEAIKDDHPNLHAVIQAANGAAGEDMGAFICWLGVRLLEMHRILKPTGSLYLHIDHTAHAYTKAMLDAIFGREHFRNEIVWQRMSGTKSTAKRFFTQHDTLLYYVKSEDNTWNRELEPLTEEEVAASWFKYTDPDGRRYKINDLTAPSKTGGHEYEFLGAVRRWRYQRDKMEQLLAAGLIHHKTCTPGAGNEVAVKKRYLDEMEGRPFGSVWTNIKALNRTNVERTGYPTQKPLALYERIIKASSDEGDLVLDPFAGCATTCIAAERLGRDWIAIDINQDAKVVVRKRLQQEARLPLGSRSWDRTVRVRTKPPRRTDGGAKAAPELVLVSPTPRGPRMTIRELRQRLSEEDGPVCQGCGYRPPNDLVEYLEVDHRQPRSRQGPDGIRNRVLLCAPCNGTKGNKLTLAELRLKRILEGRMLNKAWTMAWYEREGKFG